MTTRKKQLLALGLIITMATIFGIVSVSEQLNKKTTTASATEIPQKIISQAEYTLTNTDLQAEKNEQLKQEKSQKENQEKKAQEAFNKVQEQQKIEAEQAQLEAQEIQEMATEIAPTQAETPVVKATVSQEQVEQPTATETPVQQEPAPTPQAPQTPRMTLTIAGTVIPYQNGGANGQAIIDANGNGTASTFGGAGVQSGTDNLNTHFIGHNPGIFSAVFNLGHGSQVIVTDANGTPTTYTVSQIVQVDDYGFGVQDSVDYYDTIIGTGGGERITLQTCINDTTNLIVIAYA